MHQRSDSKLKAGCGGLKAPWLVDSVWDLRSKRIVRTLETEKVVTSIEVQHDSRFFTTADGNEAKIWDGASLSKLRSFEQPYLVESASYCPEKGRFVVGGEDMWVHLHDSATGAEVEVNKGKLIHASCAQVLNGCTAVWKGPTCILNSLAVRSADMHWWRRPPRSCAHGALCTRGRVVCLWI